MIIPKELKKRGRKMWADITGKYEFDPHEIPVLMKLCRSLDRIDDLQAALDRDGLMIAGSAGQQILHPAVAEQRQQQATVARLVTQLNLDAEGSTAMLSRITSQAQAAANARWNRSKAARRG